MAKYNAHEKARDFVLAVYNDCRSEIRERIGLRDQWISRYVFGVVVFLGASLGLKDITPSLSFYLCLVMPLMSLVVALNVSAHQDAIENLANFLRADFNQTLIDAAMWAPFWDWRTSQDRGAKTAKETARNRRRRLVNILSVHGPSLASLAVAGVALTSMKFSPDNLSWATVAPPLAFFGAVAVVTTAIAVTVASFNKRFDVSAVASDPRVKAAAKPSSN